MHKLRVPFLDAFQCFSIASQCLSMVRNIQQTIHWTPFNTLLDSIQYPISVYWFDLCAWSRDDQYWTVPRTYRSTCRQSAEWKLFETQMTERLFNQPEQLKDTIMYFSLTYLFRDTTLYPSLSLLSFYTLSGLSIPLIGAIVLMVRLCSSIECTEAHGYRVC